MIAFPNGKYDDQVDSLSQFLFWVQLRDHGRTFFMPPPPGGPQQGAHITICGDSPDLTIDDLFNIEIF